MKAIVTFSLGPEFQRKNHHDPKNKKFGPCPLDPTTIHCTDITGSHHSRLFEDEGYFAIMADAKAYMESRHCVVTRVEIIEGFSAGHGRLTQTA